MSKLEVELRPITGERIEAELKKLGIRFAVNAADSSILLPYPNFTAFIARIDDDRNGKCLVFLGQWGRRLNVAYIALAKNIVQSAASSTYAPRMAFKVTDDGYIVFSTSWRFQWDSQNVTDLQLREELRMAIAATSQAMDRLEHEFADPWMNPPEEPKVD